jgi:hypothetical protein
VTLLVDELVARGTERIELHATDVASHLYVDLGFEPHRRAEYWLVPSLMRKDDIPRQ